MSSQVEQIKERLGIADVIASYIKIEKSGINFKARCPFHNEKTPSFFISTQRNNYYCFGCGAKGDIFSFVQEFEGVDFIGSLKVLAARAGVELKREDPKTRTERERLYLCLESATIFFQKNLYTKSENADKVDYLLKRGLTKDTIKEWRIGYAEDEWRALLAYLKDKRFTEQDMERVGLIKKKDGSEGRTEGLSSSDYYDRFRSRIMFPIFDTSERVIGFSGRIFGGDDNTAKYLNSPETELFNKSQVLYGLHKAKTAIREKDSVILVEGQMDMLMSQQAGFQNTVAVSGTALTAGHLETVRRLTNKVIMAFDPDSAGVKAAERSARIALSLGMDVRVAALPKGEDPALFILNRKDEWKAKLDSGTHIVEFMLAHVIAVGDDSTLSKRIKDHVLPFIASLESSMERARFVNQIYRKTGFKEEAIWEDLRKVQGNVEQERTELKVAEQRTVQQSRKNAIVRKLLGIIWWQESQKEPVIKVDEITKKFREVSGAELWNELVKSQEPYRDELILEAEISYDKSSKLQSEVDELLFFHEEEYLKKRFTEAMAELSKAERDKDTAKVQELLARCKQLSEQLSNLPKLK